MISGCDVLVTRAIAFSFHNRIGSDKLWYHKTDILRKEVIFTINLRLAVVP